MPIIQNLNGKYGNGSGDYLKHKGKSGKIKL